MKKYILTLLVLLCSLGLWAEGVDVGADVGADVSVDVEELWQRASTLYTAGDYNGAAATYDSIVNEGLESAPLYYNLAGAYFKAGKTGKAIVNYRRALRINPADGDAAYNLAYAESFIKDRIEEVPELALGRWASKAGRTMSVGAWGVVSLVALGLFLGAALIYLLAARGKVRKAGFVVALVALVVTVAAVSFGGGVRSRLLADDEAVVLSSAAVVKASPERTSKDLFILHEGTTVEVLDQFGEWSEIRIADGNKGWIRSSAIEII